MSETQGSAPSTTIIVPEAAEKKPRFGFFGGGNKHEIERITIRTFPKIVFLYPTMIFAFICAIFVQFDWGNRADWGLAFMVLLAFNLCVLSFDFPRTASLTLIFSIVAIVLAAILLNERAEFLPALADLTGDLKPAANSTFYWMLGVILALIFLIVWLLHRYVDYWEVLSNELIHHHGILGGIQRLPAPGIKLDKEITDVFEYLLLRSGRLVIHPQGEDKAIILDNVPNINRVEDGVKAILGVTEVSFRQRDRTLT
ncbi:MAG: hypothetical protein M3Y37_07280 [Chloroflexota bacterium]|nr:hypothetical protein [Chloroflexota bacterium]